MIEILERPPVPLEESNPILAEIFKNECVSEAANEIKEHDKETYDHSVRVAVILTELATYRGLSKDDTLTLATAGLLHDLGKKHVDEDTLKKDGLLTEQEREHMSNHVEFSYLRVQSIDKNAAEILIAHHEHQDQPYPRKETRPIKHPDRRKDNPNLNTMQMLLALADQTDALLSKRYYKEAMTAEQTDGLLQKNFADDTLIKESIKARQHIATS